MSRKATNRVVELMDAGILSPEAVCHACLMFMSDKDVDIMSRCEWEKELKEFFEKSEKSC
jgi:hypothetical protein